MIVKNIASEGPGTIGDFLEDRNMAYSILEIYDCKAEIPDIRNYSCLVVMGGPMAVYEIDEHQHLSIEVAMIRAFIKSKKPVLGICLGAQLVAYALGADVYPGSKVEIGWKRVEITKDGMDDPVVSNISVNNDPYAEVFQWHGDTFDLPNNSVRLSSSEEYRNQAFRYKENVYGLQYHIEVTPEIIKGWFINEQSVNLEDMLRETGKIYTEYRNRAMKFYDNFFKGIQ